MRWFVMAYLSTVAPFGFKDFHPPTLLPVYRELGCRACQWYRDPQNAPQPVEARRVVEDAGLVFDSVHGLFGPSFDPSSPDENIRRRAVETYREEGEIALKLGGWGVVVHPAPLAEKKVEITDEQRRQRIAPLQRSMEELARIGEAMGVVYLFENLPATAYIGHEPAALAHLLRTLNHPCARMCLDTGHANMTGDPVQAVHECLDVIRYLHVHDNDGQADSHEVPGTVANGGVDWPALAREMAQLDEQTPAMLELFKSEAEMRDRTPRLSEQLREWLCLQQQESGKAGKQTI